MNLNPIILVSLIDIVLLSGISAIMALGLALFGIPFLSGFLVCLGFNISIGIISNRFVEARVGVVMKKLELEDLKLRTAHTVQVKCSYCGVQHEHLFQVNGDMVFRCRACNQENKIVCQYGVARTTTPLNVGLPVEAKSE